MDRLIELLNFARGLTKNEDEQAQILAAFGDPPKDYKPKANLPVLNEMPAFNLGQKSLGGALASLDYGVAAPVPGKTNREPSLGELLIGEGDGY